MNVSRTPSTVARTPRSSIQRTRRSRNFVPDLIARLESRQLLSVATAKAAITSSAGSLPAEVVGSSTDMTIPGPQDGSTHEITVGPDGNFWITQESQDRVVEMTLDGKFTFFPMGAGSTPHGEEFDAQGHLWVGLEGYGELVEMNTNGQILGTHVIPYTNTYGYSPTIDNHGLTIARDGKIWFTGKASNTVGYYDPSTNQFQVYALANPNPTLYPEGNDPIYINEAPDGSMYFTELDTSRVGRLFPSSGQVIDYILPGQYGMQGNARPISVMFSSNGTAVVGEEGGYAYAYISPQGVVTEYPLSPSGSEAASLTYDRAGVLWVQYNTPDAIAQVQPNGSVIPYTIPTLDATQHRITIGPDGALWFTELAVDKIGRMVTGTENGPAISSVSSQNFQAKHGGINYKAAFKQSNIVYTAQASQQTKGSGNDTNRQDALAHFSWNVQGAINALATAKGAATYGVIEPKYTGPNVHTTIKIQGGRLNLTQSETIGSATYVESFSEIVGSTSSCAKTKITNYSSLSSATAHYLEALKVLSNDV